MSLLETINGPADLHGLSDDQLEQVAQEVRELIIDTIGEIGGHFGANLGACEIAVALHSLLDSPTDKIVWDVGHQAYPHNRLNPNFYRSREGFEERLTKLPAGIGERFERLGPILKESLKAYWAPGLFFEELDLAYVGVIDGHDVHALRQAVGEALEADRPVVVHVKTVKGKGFAPAEDGGLEGMEKWHAAKPASIVGRRPAEEPAKTRPEKPVAPQYTSVFGNALVEECKGD